MNHELTSGGYITSNIAAFPLEVLHLLGLVVNGIESVYTHISTCHTYAQRPRTLSMSYICTAHSLRICILMSYTYVMHHTHADAHTTLHTHPTHHTHTLCTM